MLPKEKRLDKKTFTEIFKTGRRMKMSCLQCIYNVSGAEKDRFAVVVPKKVISSKPKSNIVRRRFYGALKKSAFEGCALGVDVIFLIDDECAKLSESEIAGLLSDLYNKFEKQAL